MKLLKNELFQVNTVRQMSMSVSPLPVSMVVHVRSGRTPTDVSAKMVMRERIVKLTSMSVTTILVCLDLLALIWRTTSDVNVYQVNIYNHIEL